MINRSEDSSKLVDIRFPDEANRTKAIVRSVRDPSKEYKTDTVAKTCECGIPDIDIGPCKHLIHHARAIGVPLVSMLDRKDSWQGYEAQYPASLNFDVPSESVVVSTHGHLIDDNVRLPLTVRRKTGRPVSKRKKSAHELWPQKRAMSTCSRCHREGHNKKRCTYMQAPS